MALTSKENLNGKSHRAIEQIDQLSFQAGETLGGVASDISGAVTNYVKSGKEYLEKNPTKGLAVVLATGVVIGSLIVLALGRKQ